MSRWLLSSRSRRLAGILLPVVLAACSVRDSARAQALADGAAVTVGEALAREEGAVRTLVARLAQPIEAHDAETWKRLGLDSVDSDSVRGVSAKVQMIRVGFSGDGSRALARYALSVWGTSGGQNVLLKQGTQDLALARGDAWSIVGRAWDVPEPTADALGKLAATQSRVWAWMHSTPKPDNPQDAPPKDMVLHLVAERRGGRWIVLRVASWYGRVLSPQAIAQRERASAPGANNTNTNTNTAAAASLQWTEAQLKKWARVGDGRDGGGTLHLLLQNGARDWVGLDGVWEPRLSQASQAMAARPAAAGEAPDDREPAPLSAEASGEAGSLRTEIGGDPVLLGDFSSHKKLAQVLEGAGLFGEAADEWEKAAALVPAIPRPGDAPSAARLAGARARRPWDPRARNEQQWREEGSLGNRGLDVNHPTLLLGDLKSKQDAAPTPLRALRIGLEYSKLGLDRLASAWLDSAKEMLARGWKLAPADAAWVDVLTEHLEQRSQLSGIKPPNLLSSDLFSVRCRQDDLSVLPILAGLDSARHTVYGEFKIPMGSTEVVLWPDQSSFQSYTTRFSSQGASEFVAALTLTKLIETQGDGPFVLGEEVNAFVDPRLEDATFGTVAHEYGHVAVRQMSRGRSVPVWLNEGIATVVQGGYDGAVERVRGAQKARRLLSMNEMRQWDVDGERAFLAYSQANSMVDFVIARWGSGKMLDILRLIGQDMPPEQAFSTALGMGTDRLWQLWAREGIR